MNNNLKNRSNLQAVTFETNPFAEPTSRRRLLHQTGVALAALGLLGATAFSQASGSQESERASQLSPAAARPKPTVVLVHGAWADGTSWQGVIPKLEQAGYKVIAVQNPLSGLGDDVAKTKRVIDAQTGPIIAVGHSYGGAVITGAAAGNPNVKALVYIAAFAPAANEPIGALLGDYPTELGTIFEQDAAGFVYLGRERFREIFAGDVDRTTARVMAAAQKPAFGGIFAEFLTQAAWETIPAWYMVATKDKALHPDMERFFAQRMGATTVEIEASHVAYISQPNKVFNLIEAAARATVS